MPERVLGTVFEGRDQGQAMLLSSFFWLLYLALVSFADAEWTRDLVPTLTRFGSMWCMVAACLIFVRSMPKYLQVPARITAAIALVGIAIQMSGVFKLMQQVPNFGDFVATYWIAQLIYSCSIIGLAYCLCHHPLFPRWVCVLLVIDALFWMAYYIASVSHFAHDFFEFLAWGPSLFIEGMVGFLFVRAGFRLMKLAEPEATHSV